MFEHIHKVYIPKTHFHKIHFDFMLSPTPERSWHSDSPRAVRSGDRTPVGERFSSPVQTGPEAHPAFYTCTMGTGSFPGVKRPRRGVKHTPHLTSKLKKEQTNTSTPHLCHTASYKVNFTFTFLPTHISAFRIVLSFHQMPVWKPQSWIYLLFPRYQNFSSGSFHISTAKEDGSIFNASDFYEESTQFETWQENRLSW
jgi:hypothetical protein